jgi:hypothetical protein
MVDSDFRGHPLSWGGTGRNACLQPLPLERRWLSCACSFHFRNRNQLQLSRWWPARGHKAYSKEARCPIMSLAMPESTPDDWVKTVLFDRGYLARIRGDAIKVYLAIIEASGGLPDRSVTISLSLLMRRTKLSCPTVIESLSRLEELGLVVSTTHQRGKVKTYYVSDPPAGVPV